MVERLTLEQLWHVPASGVEPSVNLNLYPVICPIWFALQRRVYPPEQLRFPHHAAAAQLSAVYPEAFKESVGKFLQMPLLHYCLMM